MPDKHRLRRLCPHLLGAAQHLFEVHLFFVRAGFGIITKKI